MSTQPLPNTQDIADGKVYLGIELGSTRIKSSLIDSSGIELASGSHTWENQLVDGHWSYSEDAIWQGIAASYQNLSDTVTSRYGATPQTFKAIGVSAMMHGYMAFDSEGKLLVPFRTWRDTTTEEAANALTENLQINIPLRWSVSHLYQAILNKEEHIPEISYLTTLAGYVHWKLTGQKVLGVGDASGMFPIDSTTVDYDQVLIKKFNSLASDQLPVEDLRSILPTVLPAGQVAGTLTPAGAKLLDPSGTLQPGIALCPPEGDAGTGMVATNAVRTRTGNVSVGTSIFAMVVLEKPLKKLHRDLDLVTTPSGEAVAMVHCNNGADELSKWISLFSEVALAFGTKKDVDLNEAYEAILQEAFSGDPDAGGVIAYNTISGEPVAGITEGRPLFARASNAKLTLGNFMRAQLYSVFAALAIGFESLQEEEVSLDFLNAHGGLFKTPVVGQRFLAAATQTPIVVSNSAGEGGSWGIALLAAYLDHADQQSLADYLDHKIFHNSQTTVLDPKPTDVEGFKTFLTRYRAGLEIQKVAAETISNL